MEGVTEYGYPPDPPLQPMAYFEIRQFTQLSSYSNPLLAPNSRLPDRLFGPLFNLEESAMRSALSGLLCSTAQRWDCCDHRQQPRGSVATSALSHPPAPPLPPQPRCLSIQPAAFQLLYSSTHFVQVCGYGTAFGGSLQGGIGFIDDETDITYIMLALY